MERDHAETPLEGCLRAGAIGFTSLNLGLAYLSCSEGLHSAEVAGGVDNVAYVVGKILQAVYTLNQSELMNLIHTHPSEVVAVLAFSFTAVNILLASATVLGYVHHFDRSENNQND